MANRSYPAIHRLERVRDPADKPTFKLHLFSTSTTEQDSRIFDKMVIESRDEGRRDCYPSTLQTHNLHIPQDPQFFPRFQPLLNGRPRPSNAECC